MPELPEVEVTRRSFADRISDARILGVRVGKPLRWPLGIAPERLVGRTVLDVGRRGKYLLLRLSDGVLLLHLGMSGRLSFQSDPPPPQPHDHFDLRTTRGVLRLRDPRRFGAVVWSPALDADPARRLLANLGVEPLDAAQFDPARFHAGLQARRAPIKQALLAGDLVVGVGNIYACEALFAAGIGPAVPANRLTRLRSDRLHAAIVQVLTRALEQGGSTLRDFASATGESGHFQLQAAVYGRAGQPCPRCGAPIERIRQAGRSTWFCPRCQRR